MSRKKVRERRPRKTRAAEPASVAGLRIQHTWMPILVALAGCLAYANSFSGQFVFDDDRWIVDNKSIEQISPGLLKDRRPVISISLAINYAVGKRNPTGYHIVNLAAHLLAAFALFGIVRRTLMSKPLRDKYGPAASWLALAVALLWVVHPLHTQAVMYIIQRAEAMMGLFYLTTLYCVLRGAGSSRARLWYSAAVTSCALGMGCKAVMITAPLVVLLYDRTFLAGSFSVAIKKRWGLYVCLAGTFIVLAWVGVVQGVLNPAAHGSATVGFGFKGVTPIHYLLTQAAVIPHYLRLAFWPDPLSLDYAWPYVTGPTQVVLPGLFMMALLTATVLGFVRKHPLGFVSAAFFLILGPTSSFIPIRDAAYEHRMYLSVAALIILVVFLSHRLLELLLHKGVLRIVACGLVLAATIALGARTFHRNKDYHDDTTIWRTALEVNPTNARAHYNLGKELVDQATQCRLRDDDVTADAKVDEAIEHYKEALARNPKHQYAHNNLGMELAKKGKLKEAMPYFENAIRLNPRNYKVWSNLGVTLMQLGRLDEAIEKYHKAIGISPETAESHYNLGLALYGQRKYAESVEAFKKALRFNPEYSNAQKYLNAAKKLEQKDKPRN